MDGFERLLSVRQKNWDFVLREAKKSGEIVYTNDPALMSFLIQNGIQAEYAGLQPPKE